MSRVYYHTPSGTAQVLGREHTYLGYLTHETAMGLLVGRFVGAALHRVINPQSYAYETVTSHGVGDRQLLSVRLGLFGDDLPAFVLDGKPVAHWPVLLNSVLQACGDSLRLAARLYAQAEVHCYAEGPDRAWLAGLIRDARRDGMFRAGMGWESVVELLEARDDEPVVLAYSGEDGFPDPHLSTWTLPAFVGDEDQRTDAIWDAWGELSTAEQWRHGMEWLREHGPRLQPGEWADYRFTHRLSVFDLARTLNEPEKGTADAG